MLEELLEFGKYYLRRRFITFEDCEEWILFFLEEFTRKPLDVYAIDYCFDDEDFYDYWLNNSTRLLLFFLLEIIRFCKMNPSIVEFFKTLYVFFLSYFFVIYFKEGGSLILTKFLFEGGYLFKEGYYYRHVVVAFSSVLSFRLGHFFFLLTKYIMNRFLDLSDREILHNLTNVPEKERLRNGYLIICCYVINPWFLFLSMLWNAYLLLYMFFFLFYVTSMQIVISYFIVRGHLTVEEQYFRARYINLQHLILFLITYSIPFCYMWCFLFIVDVLAVFHNEAVVYIYIIISGFF